MIEYRNRTLRTLGWVTIATAVVFGWCASWSEPDSGGVAAALFIAGAGSVLGWRFGVRPTCYANDDELVIVNPLSQHHIEWHHIEHLEQVNGPVRVVCRNGRRVGIYSTAQLYSREGAHPYSELTRVELELWLSSRQRHAGVGGDTLG